MPKLRLLSILLAISTIILMIFLFMKLFIVLAVSLCAYILLLNMWYKLLCEELIIYHLFKNGYKLEYDQLIKSFSNIGSVTLERLETKKIIRLKEGIVYLLIKDYRFSVIKDRIG